MAMQEPALVHSDGRPVRILVVEDQPNLAELLQMTMRGEGWEADWAPSGTQALALAGEKRPDALILDVMIPGIDGLQVAERLRQRGDDVPILFLTAKDDVADRIAGLAAGGDDYVTKPFSLEEVVLRLRAILRRRVGTATPDDSSLVVGDLALNPLTHEVSRGGVRVDLTATEFALLQYLMENPRHVLSKSQILDRVWNYDFGGKASVVEIYISYLRKKIDTLGPPMIHTLRGVGYTIRPAGD